MLRKAKAQIVATFSQSSTRQSDADIEQHLSSNQKHASTNSNGREDTAFSSNQNTVWGGSQQYETQITSPGGYSPNLDAQHGQSEKESANF